MKKIESLIEDLPDPEAARRFLQQFGEKNPAPFNKLQKNEGLLSDVLTLVAYSPLLAATVLQNPNYLVWLNRHRAESKIRDKEELLESLGRFALTNSTIEPQILLARFRRRELMRIFLHDIRRLKTIAETTEEISNLADAILEYALRLTRQELDNRYGIPLEKDEKGRAKPADFCIVSLGKLGSKELNYSSDIDLLFLYSAEGSTSGQGARGAVTNREYFVKLAELATKLVGHQTGEGAAYRVDLRLRPHGRVGALALSVADTVRYYRQEARNWERQVLIRSRASAGEAELYRRFFAETEDFIFSKNETIEDALENVRLSKEKINLEKSSAKGFNVKLGAGGIREIEFIAQALQLAHGGRDEWLRAPHTLISLQRLSDRLFLRASELTALFDAYEFLRRLEHLLQMENGLQTHLMPEDAEKRNLLAKRMNCRDVQDFERTLENQTANVSRIFKRIFSKQKRAAAERQSGAETIAKSPAENSPAAESRIANFKFENQAHPNRLDPILSSLEKSDLKIDLSGGKLEILEKLAATAPPFAELLAANPILINDLPSPENELPPRDYAQILLAAVAGEKDLAPRLGALRRQWARLLLEIVTHDLFERISLRRAKDLQTELAGASIEAALYITREELEKRFAVETADFSLAVLGLGKLGGRGMDYGSDLDLVLIYRDEGGGMKDEFKTEGSFSSFIPPPSSLFYARAVEIFVTALSAMTREGNLYRVDLRLRPDGKNGATSLGRNAFLDYLENRAAIWEWLAYVKLRAAGGDLALGTAVETEARRIIHAKAFRAAAIDLKRETWRIRERLEAEKSKSKKGREIDIKFGAGGLLDVYFGMRFLQLRDDLADDELHRATSPMLEKLRLKGSLSAEDYESFKAGYEFLSALDHHLRLTVGRSTRLPIANQKALEIIAARMKLASVGELLEKLTFHRLNIRASFENILKD